MSAGLLAPDDDLPLLDRIVAGDAQAFEELVQRHEERVYRVTIAITGNHEDAEEAMQQTFLKVYQHLGGFQRASKFTTWLTRIAVNEALQKRRRQRVTESLDDPRLTDEAVMPKQLRDWHDDPEKIYSKQQMREIVESAIQSLAPMYREVFVLRDVQGLTTQEAAEALGIAVSALKSRLLRARLMMREALAGHFQRPITLKSRIFQVRWKIQDALVAGFR
ncbi:MAG: sigma-70 family RNA polymerase sigma factor [Acidobacteria bacterium]|nr:sigma-70 family RNA polymerase sigma factor [Acidobacteriota bacterium]